MRASIDIFFIITIFFAYLIFIGAGSIVFQATETKQLDPEFYKSLEPTQSQGTIQAQRPVQAASIESTDRSSTIITEKTYQNYYQPERYPLEVKENILSNVIDNDYKNDTICKLIEITNTADKSLERVDIYETIPRELNLINCSAPIRTSSICEVMRYERLSPLLFTEEIWNPISLAKKISFNETIPFTLREKFSKYDLSILKNYSSEDDFIIRQILANTFNNIITNEALYNKLTPSDRDALKSPTKKLLKLREEKKLGEGDLPLLNFMIIRDLYTSHIIKPEGYIEILDEFKIDPIAGLIHVGLSSMKPKEKLILKYYGNITQKGYIKTTTTARISGNQYPDFSFPYDLKFPSPKFNVRVVLPKLLAKPNEPIYINYIIDLVTPANISSNYRFLAKVENENSEVHLINNKSKLIFYFSNDKQSCNNSTSFTISKSGMFRIPPIIIGESQYFVPGEYVTVEEPWKTYILVLTLLFLGICTLIGGNIANFEMKNIYKYSMLIIAFITVCIAGNLLDWPFYIGVMLSILIILPIYWKDHKKCKIWIRQGWIRPIVEPIKKYNYKIMTISIILSIIITVSGILLNLPFYIGFIVGFLMTPPLFCIGEETIHWTEY